MDIKKTNPFIPIENAFSFFFILYKNLSIPLT